jgi:hypothetical protein
MEVFMKLSGKMILLAALAVSTTACNTLAVPQIQAQSALTTNAITLEWNTQKRTSEIDSSGRFRVTPLSYTDIDAVAVGTRFLTAMFKVENLTNTPYSSLVFVGNASSVNSVMTFPDATQMQITDPAVIASIVPGNPKKIGAGTSVIDDPFWMNFSQIADSYSFKAIQINHSYAVPANGTVYTAIQYSLPRVFPNNPKPFKFKVNFSVVTTP